MSEMREPRKGIKIDQSVRESLESRRIPVAKDVVEEEVSGQEYYDNYTECPYCFNVGWTTGLNSDFYITVQCASCGSLFMA